MDITSKALSVAALSFGLNTLAYADVIGYISDHNFHPLVVIENGSFSEAKSRNINLIGTLREAFEPQSASLSITAQKDYEDAYSDELGRFGVVRGKFREDAFYLLKSSIPLHSAVPSKALARDFYEYFSVDPWGKHFAEGAGSMEPATFLEQDKSVRILYETDLDSDGKKELWMTYRLMYGEVGRMVWEQVGPKKWQSIANHCFNCD